MLISNIKRPDKIVLLVIFYVILVVSVMIGIYTVDTFTHNRLIYLMQLHNNESSKKHLNDILKLKISSARATLLSYITSYTYNDMDRHERELSRTIDGISEILYVLENGGTYKEKLQTGLPESDEERYHSISYIDNKKTRFNIAVLDLRTKITDFSAYTDELRGLVIDSIIYRQSSSLDKIKDTNKRISIAAKSVDSFFDRVEESSSRLYLEAEDSEGAIYDALRQTSDTYRIMSVWGNIILGVILSASGVLLSITVYKTVKNRNQVSSELNRLNSSLEETVSRRTQELELEIRIREQKEKESIAKAQFLMEVIESLSHPFYVIDAETYEIILANNAAYEIIGSTGTTCYELTHRQNHPCDGLDHPCPLKSVITTGVPITMEHIHVVKGGEKRYFEVHGYPVKDGEGRVVQMIEYSLDITDKKDAEFALINLNSMLEEKVAERTRKLEMEIKQRESAEERIKTREKHFRQLIANISDIIAILDSNMRITYLSPSVENITEFIPDQLLGKSFEDLIHSRDRKIFEIWMERILNRENESRVVEFRLQKRSGSWINGEALAKNMLDNDIINGIVINVRDITIRKRAEDEIRKLALVMEQNPNSILVTDLDGNIEYVNPAFEKITGYALHEVTGKNPNILKTEHTPEHIFKELWDTVTRGKVWNGEFVNKKKNGDIYIEHAIIAPIMNDRGETINYLGMKENITELKKAREKAEDSSKAKSMFLANMSHEIRTPLNGLMGFLELLNETALDSDQKEYVNTIKFSANALLGILNNILDLSKIESGMLELERAEIDLGFNILSTAKTFYARADENGIRIYTYIDPDIPKYLLGDSLRINQVVSNLIGNAIKFTPAGGNIRIDARLARQTRKKAVIQISVEDTGVGIPEEKLAGIFESFAQVDISVTRKYGGTGLGLTISRDLLKLMGSEIKVESRESQGSRFHFELKLDKVSAGELEKTTSVEGKIYILGSEPPELFALVEKYLSSVDADYELLNDIPDGEKLEGSKIVLINRNAEDIDMDRLSQSVERVVIVASYAGRNAARYSKGNITKMSAPFGGREFYEALSGREYQESVVQDDKRELHVFRGRVLVAEDNAANMKMMETVLIRLGIDFEKAENGLDALELCTAKKFDLVFMDINMPELDGATAVRKIREYENSFYKKRVPVIALTAHASGKAEHKFPDSDFDGYLTKPVKMQDVEEVLGSYLKKIEDDEEDRPHFDYMSAASDTGLPKEIVASLLKSFASQSERDLTVITTCLEAGEYEKIKSLANSNKGAADNLRLLPVAAIFNSIEKSARLKNNDDIINNVDKLKAELEKLIISLSGV